MKVSQLDGVPSEGAGSESEIREKKPCVEEISVLESTSVSEDSVLDVSGKKLELSLPGSVGGGIKEVFLYRNVFNLIPRSIGGVGKLKTFKFFANDVNIFPEEFGNLEELESLQLKVATPGLGNLSLHKLATLKELELCQVPPRPSAFSLFAEISGIKGLTRLSVCHFSIRFLPPEIRYLSNLEHLDLSFNNMILMYTDRSGLIVEDQTGMKEECRAVEVVKGHAIHTVSPILMIHTAIERENKDIKFILFNSRLRLPESDDYNEIKQ
uniref:Uncharacterized protein n=1 Tax=Kalanchoe fedtschenkoi TaxID=63787 RepID=A0A7N0TUG8_KALFE